MKKNIFMFLIIILFVLLIVSNILLIKYKKEVSSLSLELSKLKESSSKNIELEDVKIDTCMGNCHYTTICMNDCVYAATENLEKHIDETIKLLESKMNTNQIEYLHASQKKWLDFNKSQQFLNSQTIGKMNGTIHTNILAGKQYQNIKNRAKELDELYYYIK